MIVVPGYTIVTDDLLFNIDSFYPPSYGGSGTVLTDTVKGLTVDFDGAAATGYGISPYTTPNGWYFNGSNTTEYVNQNSSDFVCIRYISFVLILRLHHFVVLYYYFLKY